MNDFLNELSSSAPVPGGGGASALVGGISCALCSMVANLTTGKKKYAQYQSRIDELLPYLEELRGELLADIKLDADAFYPLSQAYSIPKDDPKRDEIMEEALLTASNAPTIIHNSELGGGCSLDFVRVLCRVGATLAVARLMP